MWAQTLATVTPQRDGVFREIGENVVVSGTGDSPLHLDTGMIVMRRSLINTGTREFINSAELEASITVECQTYLQGVPKVQELLICRRDEATQTLYMMSSGDFHNRADIISVLNNKSLLPQWKVSKIVETIITFENEISFYEHLQRPTIVDDETTMRTENIRRDEEIGMEISDLVNFVIDRTLWMTEPAGLTEKEVKHAEAQTLLKYNNKTKKITMDEQVQTRLRCEPKDSNTMLLFEYKVIKKSCARFVQECLEEGVYPRIMIDCIVDEIVAKCHEQVMFPLVSLPDKTRATIAASRQLLAARPTRCAAAVSPKIRRTEEILLVDTPFESRQESSPLSTESRKSLTTRDEKALRLFKSAFCDRANCRNRKNLVAAASPSSTTGVKD